MLPPGFKSTGLYVQEKKRKIEFQDGHPCGHLRFLIGTILAYFLSISYPDASYRVSIQLVIRSGEEVKNRFSRRQNSGHLGFPIGTILAIFDLQVTPMDPT